MNIHNAKSVSLCMEKNEFLPVPHHIFFHDHPHCTHLATINMIVPMDKQSPQKTSRYVNSPWSLSSNAPPMGLPVRAPTEINANNVPDRTPI